MPLDRIFLQGAVEDVLEEGMEIGAECGRRRMGSMANGKQQCGYIVGGKGRSAGQQFKHHDSKRKQI